MATNYIQCQILPEDVAPSTLTVNRALDALKVVAENEVAVTGVLRFRMEGAALDHYPEAERQEAPLGRPPESSSIWLYFGSPALQSYESRFRTWNGARVVVRGVLKGPAFHGGCGHLSAWPAEIVACSIESLDRPSELDIRSVHPVRERVQSDLRSPKASQGLPQTGSSLASTGSSNGRSEP